ncbi:Sulfate/thiosulfate import ATP-binding protein CysA [Roseovarius litorisediminis]|uniref:Sulfate/thiosulfate import ATP-binding protein CysA n=1 Tax=Roseovarius litorisediminis TaxID=1312363 RepID=A0A1Y5SW52_9RHOB|nr:molybdenum ABC transporter ATP-binding protein [Roseovarius litorisediminis]SLN48337.1 Sulfate/thiosulfate import ATP-binding protein CysA [Roseovarius litorisediminis]
MSSLQVQITHRFDALTLDLAFEAGLGVTALFGPSGSGKTSTINAIAGLFTPDSGRVSLKGKTLFDVASGVNLAPQERRIGYVFQDGRLFPHLTVEGNIRFGMRFADPAPGPEEMRQVVEMLGLQSLLERRPGTLSGGEKQRVALARALLSKPHLLLMDEPLAALDEPRKEEIFPYLERLRDEAGMPIIYVSHSLAEVARLADDLVVMQDGKVVCAGSAEDVLSDPAALPFVGVREAGAILPAQVVEHGADGLCRLAISGGELLLPGVTAKLGAWLRIRVLAQDIILSNQLPAGLSSRNILPVKVEAIHKGGGPGVAIGLRAGKDRLLARITARAAAEMDLKPGKDCFAILKATAVPRGSIGVSRGF